MTDAARARMRAELAPLLAEDTRLYERERDASAPTSSAPHSYATLWEQQALLWGWHNPSDGGAAHLRFFRALRDAGVGMLVTNSQWARVEATAGAYNWSLLHARVAPACAAGLRVSVVFDVSGRGENTAARHG